MEQSINASDIVAKALTLLWTGEGYKESSWYGSGFEKFGCHAVEKAFEILAGVSESEAGVNETVAAIKARINTYIGGYDTAYGYVSNVLNAPCGVVDMQNFRFKMLREIQQEFVDKEFLQEKIRILEAVRELRTSGGEHRVFVCWDIEDFAGYNSSEGKAIKEEIDRYLGGRISVRALLEDTTGKTFDQFDEEVLAARISMIDVLLARYRTELEAA